MRCAICGWVASREGCPCAATQTSPERLLIPVGARVLARAGRGPSMSCWEKGEVTAHVGKVHRVETSYGVFWCEMDDLLVESPERLSGLTIGARVWALWVDGRWYPGTIDGSEGSLRHVAWDDGDNMWLEASHAVPMRGPAEEAAVGARVIARRWDGRCSLRSLDSLVAEGSLCAMAGSKTTA